MPPSGFEFSFGGSRDCYICSTPKECKWMGIPRDLSEVLQTYATDILGVAIGLHGSYWVHYQGKDGRVHRQWFGLPPHLENDMKKEKPLEVSLGPNGSWFWCNDHKCKRVLHLPPLEASIKSHLDEAPGTLKWVAMGKTSGVALFKHGYWTSHNAPIDLKKAMESNGEGIDKVYLSPHDDIHYILKWRNGSFTYCLPPGWAADLDSLIGNHSSANGPTSSSPGAESGRKNLSTQRRTSIDSEKAVARSPPGAKAAGMLQSTQIRKAADAGLINSSNLLQHDRRLLQLFCDIVRAPMMPANVSIVGSLNDKHIDRTTFQAIHYDRETLIVSPQSNPLDWIHLNRKHVAATAHLSLGPAFTTACETCKVYPRLTLYTLACVKFSSYIPKATKQAKLSSMLQVLESWNVWDDVTALAHHQVVRKYLLAFLNSINQLRDTHGDDPNETHSAILDQVLVLDANVIDASLLAILQDRIKYKHVVKLRDQEAQSLLNLLQARLGFPLDASLKHLHIRALVKLSRSSGLYPECMTLKGIQLVGSAAVDGGGFGDIWKGLLNGQEIAVKVLRVFRKSEMNKLLKEFCSEAVLWRQLNHPNVLPFYGVFRLEDGRLCFASPWMKNGNVVQYLETVPKTKCVPLILDIAEGLNYLHTHRPGIIHGDIKGVNILITASRRACLADFGLSTTNDSITFLVTSAASTKAKGTLRWQAPELLDPEMDDAICINTFASDVYAYGGACYEIFSGQVPFKEISNDYRIMSAIREAKRPSRPLDNRCRIRGLDDGIWAIIQACWSQNPDYRPTVHQIVEKLRSSLTRVGDERPFDHFDPSFPSRTLYSQAEHPFSALPCITNNH